MGIESKDDQEVNNLFGTIKEEKTDLIPIYEFYHRRSDALPDGRYMIIISPKAVAYDGPLPYRFIPVFRMAPSDILGTPLGYTPMFDCIPLQETVNALYSTVATNQNAFGVQNILLPKGANINTTELSGGLNILEYEQGMGKPEALNLTQTPAEIFNFIKMIENQMETLSGINSVVRGNPEASLKSGTALAMVQAQAVQFANGLQQSYIRLIEDVGTSIIKLLQDFATTPRVASIVGKSNKSYVKQFKGEDLSSINRVKVTVANPLSKTTAGRLEIANSLIQMGLIQNIDDYFTVLNTGSLETMTDSAQNQLFLIRAENERLADMEMVKALPTDQHVKHIEAHAAILNDPDLRMNDELAGVVLNHIQEHIDMLKTINPELLMILKQQPLSQTPPQAGEAPPENPTLNRDEAAAAESVVENVQEPLPIGVDEANQVRQANLPSPPPPFQNLPTNPADVPPGGVPPVQV